MTLRSSASKKTQESPKVKRKKEEIEKSSLSKKTKHESLVKAAVDPLTFFADKKIERKESFGPTPLNSQVFFIGSII